MKAKAIVKKPGVEKESPVSQRQRIVFSQSINSPIDHILFLQRTIGNQAVQRLFNSGVFQPKLEIGRTGDIYEQEADRVADAVMRMPEPKVQRQSEAQERMLRTQEQSTQMSAVAPGLETHIQSMKGYGQPLPKSIRAFFEPRFGYDFSQVRVHADAEAHMLNSALSARAFTTGQDIFFKQCEYNHSSSTGQKLIAHELAHVMQQGSTGHIQAKESGWSVEKKPSASDKAKLESILKKVDDMIRIARKIPEGKYAAENLEYWRSKKGGTKKMPASAFKSQKFIIEWLRKKPRTMFLRGAERRLKSGELVSGGTAKMYWEDSIYAPEGNRLFYALGGFTIRSDVVVKARAFSPEEGGGYLVSLVSWTCKALDEYNWDKMKSTVIPLYGEINDEELRVLEKYGYGRSFKIDSEPWTITDPKCLQEVAIE